MKNSIQKLIYLILFMICGVQMNAQVSGAATASPNSNSIPKFQTGVNMFTGAATIGLPLMTVASDNVSMPISLNYTATQGVPVGMIASNVGLGWNLSAGGTITREVKDKPDDAYKFNGNDQVGYLYNRNRINNIFNNAPPYENDDWDDITDSKLDMQPDIFHFSFGGYAGTFVFDQSGDPQLFSKQDIKIEYSQVGDKLRDIYPFNPTDTEGYIDEFRITIPDGSVYVFNKKEISASVSARVEDGDHGIYPCSYPDENSPYEMAGNLDDGYSQISSWLLTSIISPTNHEEVSIDYEAEISIDHSVLSNSRPAILIDGCGSGDVITESYLNVSFGYRLKQIQFAKGNSFGSDGYVDFVYGQQRKDFFNAIIGQPENVWPKELHKIIWRKNNIDFRTIEFVTKYFITDTPTCRNDRQAPGSNNFENENLIPHHKRLVLEQLKISGKNINGIVTELPEYTFRYNEDLKLPARHSTARDYWGYYNGDEDSDFMRPKFYFYPEDAVLNDLYKSPMSIYLRNNDPLPDAPVLPNENQELGENMEPDENFMQAGILTSIEYASGVTESFEYEPNKALFEGNEVIAGGLRIRRITSSLQPAKIYEYKLTNNKSSGRIMHMPQFGVNMKYCDDLSDYAKNMNISSISRNDFNLDKMIVAYSRIVEKVAGFGSRVTYFDIQADARTLDAVCDNGDCMYKSPKFYPTDGDPKYHDFRFYAAPNPNMSWLQGLPTRVETWSERNKRLSTVVNDYKVYNYDKINGIVPHLVPSGTASIRAIAKFYYLSGDVRIDKVTEINYGNSDRPITKVTNYQYNSTAHRFPTKVSYINSDGQEYGVENTYVADYDFSAAEACEDAYNQCVANCLGPFSGICIHTTCVPNLVSCISSALTPEEQVLYELKNSCRGWFPLETKQLAGGVVSGTKYDYADDFVGCPDCPLVKKTYSWEDNDWYLDNEVTAYNAYGRPLRIDTRDVYDTRNEYNAAGMLEYTRIGDESADGDFVTQSIYNDLNQLEMTISPDDQKARFSYDGLGQVTKTESRFSGNDPNVTLNQTYDLIGHTVLTKTTLSGVPFVPDRLDKYDVLGRHRSSRSIGYTPQGNDYITGTSYDLLGRVLKKTDPATGGTTQYIYEDQSLKARWTLIAPPNWAKKVFTYYYANLDGEVEGYASGTLYKHQTIDENGHITYSFKDLSGKNVLTRQMLGGASIDVKYNYDGQGRLQSVIQPEGQSFDYTYTRNTTGWLTMKSVPGGEMVTTQKDGRGLVMSVMDHNFTTTYIYDDYGREMARHVDGQKVSETEYYEAGKGRKGKVKWVENAVLDNGQITGTMLRTTYHYDEFGRLESQDEESLIGTDSYTYVLDHSDFTLSSSVAHRGYEEVATENTNTRDHGGRLIGIDTRLNGEIRRVATYHYDEADRMKMKNLGGTSEQTSLEDVPYRYNGRGWITSIGKVGKCIGAPDAEPDSPDDPESPGGNLGTVTTDLIEVFFDRTALCEYDITDDETSTGIQMVYKIQEEDPATGDVFVDFADTTLIELGDVDLGNEVLTDLFSISSEYRSCISLCPGSPKDMLNTIISGIKEEVPCLPVNNQAALDQIEIAVNNALARLPSCDECIDTKGLFAEGIYYNTPRNINEVDIPAQYNGNISHVIYGVKWRKADSYYGFKYDELNRLTAGRYHEKKYPGTYHDVRDAVINKGMYDVDFTYTDNGNIDGIGRRGYVSGIWPNQNQTLIDELKMTHNQQNQLMNVDESALPLKGYKNGGGYSYADGKLTSDGGKGITSILYNHLDKPYQIIKDNGTINIIYDATGRELRRTIQIIPRTGALPPPIISDYAGGIEYRNQKLINVPHAEGRYYWDSEDGAYLWEYTLMDHLGNGRVWFTDRDGDGKISVKPEKREVTQEAHYYPYGMKMDGDFRYTEQVPQDQYQYNGIDYVSDLNMDVNMAFYRTLDPATGSWWSADPKAEANYSASPYCSMYDNPISNNDPNGDLPALATAALGSLIRGTYAYGAGAAQSGNYSFSGFGSSLLGNGVGYSGGFESPDNTIFTDLNGNEIGRTNDGLSDAVVVVNDVGSFNNAYNTLGRSDADVRKLRDFGLNYIASDFNAIYDHMASNLNDPDNRFRLNVNGKAKPWQTEWSSRYEICGNHCFRNTFVNSDHPYASFNVPFSNWVNVHSHPDESYNGGTAQENFDGDWKYIRNTLSHNGPSGADRNQATGQPTSYFHVAVSKNYLHFYRGTFGNTSKTVGFKINRNSFKYE